MPVRAPALTVCVLLLGCGGDVTASGTAVAAAGTSGGEGGSGVTSSAVVSGSGGAATSQSTGGAGVAVATSAAAGGSGGCNTSEDCRQPMTECLFATCDGGICNLSPVAAGTPVPSQAPGDCVVIVCDGMGNYAEVPDDADVFDDANECTDDFCASATPVNAPSPAGAMCSQAPGKLCDGAGNCVECISPADCPNGVCTANKCG